MKKSALFGALVALAAAAPSAVLCQDVRELPSAARMLQVFEEDARADRTSGTEGIGAVQYAVTHPAAVPAAKLDSLLNGLEQMATGSETRLARIRAVMQLGRMEDSVGFDRMLRVYHAAGMRPEVRDMVVSLVEKPKLARQVSAWVTLMRGLVTQPADAEDFPDAPFEAMRQLYALGAPGIAALRDLYQHDQARNPRVRALLADWARQDFKLQESGPGHANE